MNCQAFRTAWSEDVDSDVLSHIETCEDCIAWIEKQMTTDEEVQFLKEVPLPSANLEERIMQAIYQSAGQGTPPHAATESLQAPTPIASKRRTKGFPSYAWVSAAAVLLAVGLLGYQQFQSNDQQMASQPQSTASGAADQGLAFSATENQPKSAPADAPAQSPIAMSNEAASAPAEPAKPQMQAETPAAGSAAAPSALSSAAVAINTPQAKTASPETPSAQSKTQPVSRSAAAKQSAAETVSKGATALADDVKASKSSPQAVEESAGAAAATEPAYTLTAKELPEAAQDGTANSFAGPPAPSVQKAEITLSSFSDVETAVQASDMPVPVLAQSSGFAVSDISVQYESETSQKATRLTADYKRNSSWIKIDVIRNTHGKRSLSIPGTFTATQLFNVDGEQAIGVSFDQQGTKDSSVQHAVHFNAQAANQSLYVVITAHGIELNELIETAKQLTWKS